MQLQNENLFYESLEWDSRQLGLQCGLIGFRDVSSNIKQYELADNAKKLIAENRDADFITVKLPGDFPIVLDCLVKNSARFIDTELIYKFNHTSDVTNEHDVNFFDSFDPDIFVPLAGEMIFSRFYMDDNIPLDKARKLWSDSIRNHCMGRADRLAIVYAKEQPVGMATINYINLKTVKINIVGVLKQYQGHGAGSALMAGITKEYCSQYDVFVETQVLNRKARMLYQRTGFFLESMRYILHAWK